MGQSMAEKPLRVQDRNHQGTWEVPAEELEEEKVARRAPGQVAPDQVALEQAALDNQVEQGEEAPAAAVVVTTAAEVEETLRRTLQKTLTKARSASVTMMTMMTTPRMIQIRSKSRILQ